MLIDLSMPTKNLQRWKQNSVSYSTAAVAGNLAGALLGIEQIPEFFLESLELREIIEEIAWDLWNDCPMRKSSSFFDEDWSRKYIECRYDPT